MSTAHEIEQAIRSLSASERDKLLRTLPGLLPELSGHPEWDRIIEDPTPRAALTDQLNETEADYRRGPEKFPPMSVTDLNANA